MLLGAGYAERINGSLLLSHFEFKTRQRLATFESATFKK